jgi:hypothetical protein
MKSQNRGKRGASLKGDVPKPVAAASSVESGHEAEDDETTTEDQLLSSAVTKGVLKAESALATAHWLDKELRKLVKMVKIHGLLNHFGMWEVPLGTLHHHAAREFDVSLSTPFFFFPLG